MNQKNRHYYDILLKCNFAGEFEKEVIKQNPTKTLEEILGTSDAIEMWIISKISWVKTEKGSEYWKVIDNDWYQFVTTGDESHIAKYMTSTEKKERNRTLSFRL